MQTCIHCHSTIHVFRDNSFYMYHFSGFSEVGIALHLGCRDRRFESCNPDKHIYGDVEYRLVRQIFILKSRVRLPASLQKILFFYIFSYKYGVSLTD